MQFPWLNVSYPSIFTPYLSSTVYKLGHFNFFCNFFAFNCDRLLLLKGVIWLTISNLAKTSLIACAVQL